MLEHRFISGLEVAGRTLRGRAIRYGDEARIVTATGRQARERFAPGAFGDVGSLDTTLDLMHDRRRLLARVGAGLTLFDDGRELRLEAVLPETRDADDALTLVRSGLLRGYSIEFDAGADQWAGELRTVTAAALPSIGVVDRPAYVSAEGIEIRRVPGSATESRGAALVGLLESRLPADGAERTAAIERMARTAGITASTVGQILRAEIDCPPDQRLRGFATALGISQDAIMRAVGADGCRRRRLMVLA